MGMERRTAGSMPRGGRERAMSRKELGRSIHMRGAPVSIFSRCEVPKLEIRWRFVKSAQPLTATVEERSPTPDAVAMAGGPSHALEWHHAAFQFLRQRARRKTALAGQLPATAEGEIVRGREVRGTRVLETHNKQTDRSGLQHLSGPIDAESSANPSSRPSTETLE